MHLFIKKNYQEEKEAKKGDISCEDVIEQLSKLP